MGCIQGGVGVGFATAIYLLWSQTIGMVVFSISTIVLFSALVSPLGLYRIIQGIFETLGTHTGRALTVSKQTALAYLAIAAAALIRTFGPALAPGLYNAVMMISGGFWITGYALFVVAYWPILTGPNQRRKGLSEAA